jgi:hypothetical protein
MEVPGCDFAEFLGVGSPRANLWTRIRSTNRCAASLAVTRALCAHIAETFSAILSGQVVGIASPGKTAMWWEIVIAALFNGLSTLVPERHPHQALPAATDADLDRMARKALHEKVSADQAARAPPSPAVAVEDGG